MHMGKNEHNPPHIHALYQGKKTVFNIQTGEIMEGGFTRYKEKQVSDWMALHRGELLANWELAQGGGLPFSVKPLK